MILCLRMSSMIHDTNTHAIKILMIRHVPLSYVFYFWKFNLNLILFIIYSMNILSLFFFKICRQEIKSERTYRDRSLIS